jgi:hypothetical protein
VVRRAALIVCAAASVAGCVTSMYPGPRRPASETMVIETDGTTIVRIDDVDTPGGSKFRLLPGPHRLDLKLDDAKMGRTSRIALPRCFVGRAGHDYLARPGYGGETWVPQIVDENTSYRIASDDCSPPKRRQSAPATLAAAEAPTPPGDVESAARDGGAPRDSATEAAEPPPLRPASASEVTPAPVAPPPTSAPRPPVPSVDTQAPRATAATTPQAFLPTYDIAAELGFFQGGSALVTAIRSNGQNETLGAGDGLLLGLGARVTPLWLAGRVGFGGGANAGFKVWQVGSSNSGNSSIFKWVLTATGHMALSFDPTWLVVLQAGVEKDFGIDWSIDSASSGVPFRSRTGFVGDLGLQHALSDNLSVAGSFRFTLLDYAVETETVGANSFGVTCAIHFNL